MVFGIASADPRASQRATSIPPPHRFRLLTPQIPTQSAIIKIKHCTPEFMVLVTGKTQLCHPKAVRRMKTSSAQHVRRSQEFRAYVGYMGLNLIRAAHRHAGTRVALGRGRWGWPAPGGCRRGCTGGRWPVAPGVPHGSIAVVSLAGWQIAGRMARHVMRCASCPRCPRAASLFAGAGPADSGGTVAGPRGPVLPYWSRGRPGIFGGGVNDGRADRIPEVGQYPAHARPEEHGHRLRQAGGSAAWPGPGR